MSMSAQPAHAANDATVPNLAPVIVFAYMRVDHLQRSIESLLANPEAALTDVLFFCDAAKRPEDQPQVDAVRAYINSVAGFRSLTCIYRERNMGLARSVIEGVTLVLGSQGRVIVLEDDLVLSPHFLRFMNDGLDRYKRDDRVASIHAYAYPVDDNLPETFFLQGGDCWGWATWSRAWMHFEADGAKLLSELRARKLTHDFDFDGSYPYTQMLKDQVAGRNSSWAIRWHAACYLRGLLTLYPGRSLVENIGNDASGTHCRHTGEYSQALTTSPVEVAAISVEPSAAGRASFKRFFRQQRSFATRVRSLVRRALVCAR